MFSKSVVKAIQLRDASDLISGLVYIHQSDGGAQLRGLRQPLSEVRQVRGGAESHPAEPDMKMASHDPPYVQSIPVVLNDLPYSVFIRRRERIDGLGNEEGHREGMMLKEYHLLCCSTWQRLQLFLKPWQGSSWEVL